MKNITIIVLSLILAHFKLSSGSLEQPGYITLTGHNYDAYAATADVCLIEQPAESPLRLEAPVNTGNTKKVTAKPAADMHSVVNTANRKFHQQLAQSEQIVLVEHIQFEFDDYELKNGEDFNRVMALADNLIFNPDFKISISGNTDNVGSNPYNDILSLNRVSNIQDYLLEIGVPAHQITISFNGKHNPVASNETAEGRAENRRVEMFLYK